MRVNGFAPGFIATGMTSAPAPRTPLGFPAAALVLPINEAAHEPRVGKHVRVPAARVGGLADIASLALMLVTNGYMTNKVCGACHADE